MQSVSIPLESGTPIPGYFQNQPINRKYLHFVSLINGNKRTAYVVTLLFLVLNGHDLAAPAVERVLIFEKLGKGGIAPDEFAGWLRRHGKIFQEC
jgi:hypothetical protein